MVHPDDGILREDVTQHVSTGSDGDIKKKATKENAVQSLSCVEEMTLCSPEWWDDSGFYSLLAVCLSSPICLQ